MCLHALAGALRGPPGVFVHGIFQARILEWVSFSYCRGSSWLRDWTCLSCVSRIGRQVLYHCATWEAPRCTVCCFSKKMLERYARPLNDIVAIFKANPFFFWSEIIPVYFLNFHVLFSVHYFILPCEFSHWLTYNLHYHSTWLNNGTFCSF